VSFAFLALYTGDYLRDTRHLTPLKHGVYVLSLMHCWDTRGPMPLDEQECAGICNCRSADEIESLRYILSRFFVRMDDGFYNPRMQKEIERAEAISRLRADAGRKGYEAKAKHLPSTCQATATTPTTTTTTTTTPKKEKTTRAPRASSALAAPAGVSVEVWQDFLAIRATAKAPLTATAIAGIEREAKAAGMALEAALRVCCERGWRGFKAAWVERDKPAEDVALEAIRMIEEREAKRAQG